MPYTIDKYNGQTIAVVEDGTIDSTLDIKLIGKNYAGYGEVQNENFVHMLENFAGGNAPPRPISGQIWYDANNKKLKFYDATTQKWKTTGGAEVAQTPPAGLSQGDLWYDSVNKQVYVFDGTNYVLIGPQGVAGSGTTQMKSMTVTENGTNNEFPVIAAYVDDEVMFVINAGVAFELSATSINELGGINKFRYLKSGITLVNTANQTGVTDDIGDIDGRLFWGTASSALGLYDDNDSPEPDRLLTARDFIKKSSGTVSFKGPPPVLVQFGDVGYTLGDEDDLVVKIDNDSATALIRHSKPDQQIKFQTTSAGPVINTPLRLLGINVLPGTNNSTDLGSTDFKFKNVHATTYFGSGINLTDLDANNLTSGTVAAARLSGSYTININGSATSATSAASATNADNLLAGGSYRSADVAATAATIPMRTVVDETLPGGITITAGSLKATYFSGIATSALFADLAEKYLADQDYEVGTVVKVGGDQEVTACTLGSRAFGAVSANPAYMMNSGLEGGTFIALKGRVPVKVIGAVRKGDKLIAANDGCAGVAEVLLKNIPVKAGNFPDTFAIALESNDNDGVKLVEAIIL